MSDVELVEIEHLRQLAEQASNELELAVYAWRGAVVKRAKKVGFNATAREVGVTKDTIRRWSRRIGGVYNHKNILQG